MHKYFTLFLLSMASIAAFAADYTTHLTAARGFTEVKSTADILGDADYYYLLTPAETTNLIVGIGAYEGKPSWAGEDTKALRYRSAQADPVLDMTNFFTIERSGDQIGLRNAVYDSDLFQTHDNAGYMYVNTFTDKALDEWSRLTPTWHDGYWLFESGKYPMSSGNWACGYLGPWNKTVAEGEPIALNRRNTEGDEAGHYRLWRIARADLMAQRLYATILTAANGFSEVTSTEGIIADPSQCYLITSAEQPSLFVGIGKYEAKPGWAGEDTKALRYRRAGNPVADLANFFTIEKDGEFIGLRNVVHHSSLFQTHDNAGYMYVLTYTEPTISDWCYLTPTFQDSYWLFESGKYPMSSENWACGYLGPWNKTVAADEPLALNRRNTAGDEAGHFRLWRIARTDLLALMTNIAPAAATSSSSVAGGLPADVTWHIANPSFEQGEAGWTLIGRDTNGNNEFTARTYGMTGRAGTSLMNAYQWWAASLGVSQTVADLPAGEYELSATVASWEGRSVTLAANSDEVTATGVGADAGVRVKTSVTVAPDGQLTINASSTTDWWTEGRTQTDNEAQCFFKIDDLQLRATALHLDALAVQLPNDQTPLVPGQWYYFETAYSTEYLLLGDLDALVYTTDNASVSGGLPAGSPASRLMTLPVGRTYFKTTAQGATLVISPYRNVEEGSFTAVALNVDGLPNKIATVELNPDGPGADGTKKISQYLATKNYDFIGCSEDFNYHGSLMSALTDSYSSGTVRKTLSLGDLPVWQTLQGNFQFDTDGLNLIWKNSTVAASNESWTKWSDTESTDGNQYVKKGYRHYDMWLGGNATIDVYVLHMDAGDTNATWARESQWRQLAAAINASDHSRAKLIIGDTNSRYTREDVIANFIQQLSADFTMSDVWVEFYRNGIYPTTDMNNLTDKSDPTAYANYEIVDKIIYINPTAANTVRLVPQAFRIEQDYTYGNVDGTDDTTPLGDHNPVVVTFKYILSGEVTPTAVALLDNADNSILLDNADGALANVTLQGRTLYRSGEWNTICLPFDLASLDGTPLEGATVKTLQSSQFADGILTLNFGDHLAAIQAGKPYIVRWDNAAADILNPVFQNVTIDAQGSNELTTQCASFVGTLSPVALTAGDTNSLYLGAANTLYYPARDMSIGSCRAYFSLNLGVGTAVKRCVLNTGDGLATDVSLHFAQPDTASPWHTVGGATLNARPTRKGVYLNQGRKVVVK